MRCKRWRRALQRFVVLLLPATLSGCTALFFYPDRTLIRTPADLGYAYQDVLVDTDDGEWLHAWLIEPTLSAVTTHQGTVYFLHGNAQNISYHVRATEWLLDAGFTVFALDYRGYGWSSGTPNIPEVYEDIDAGYRWLVNHISAKQNQAKTPFVVLGQSLGASLILNWVSQISSADNVITHVIADSGFSRFSTAAQDAAKGHWLTWMFQYPAKWLLTDEKDPVDSIGLIELPVLLVHGVNDRLVKYYHAEELLHAGGPSTELLTTRASHIGSFRYADKRRQILEWIGSSELEN